jgi:hypothetical protein
MYVPDILFSLQKVHLAAYLLYYRRDVLEKEMVTFHSKMPEKIYY